MKRVRNVVVAVLVLAAGVGGLFLPVAVFDGGSSTVACGNAAAPDTATPTAANQSPPPNLNPAVPHPDYVAACDEAISGRRRWAIPLAIVGAVGIIVGLVAGGRRPRKGASRQ